MTPEERREALALFFVNNAVSENIDDALDDVSLLLAYFGEHEPAVADAIRYGLFPVAEIGDLKGNVSGKNAEMDVVLYRINKPADL
jgi:hypothetical protein